MQAENSISASGLLLFEARVVKWIVSEGDVERRSNFGRMAASVRLLLSASTLMAP